MPRPPSVNTTQFAFRIPAAWFERADRLIPTLMRQGVSVTRTDVLRAAMAAGLDLLEAERAAEKENP